MGTASAAVSGWKLSAHPGVEPVHFAQSAIRADVNRHSCPTESELEQSSRTRIYPAALNLSGAPETRVYRHCIQRLIFSALLEKNPL